MKYEMLSGETLHLPRLSPKVQEFWSEARMAAADPTVDLNRFLDLIYSPRNPLLDTTILPGRAMVTKAVFEMPVYQSLADMIGRKRIQLGLLDPAAAAARYTVSVAEAARRLGITPASVRAAINAKKLAAQLDNGQWWLNEESLASYKVSNRGRRTPARTAAAQAHSEARSNRK